MRRWGGKGSSPQGGIEEYQGGEFLTLSAAAAMFPGRKPGKRLFVNTVWRWCMKGLKNGARLRSVLIAGQRYATKKWIAEFIDAMNEPADEGGHQAPNVRTANQRQSASERAMDELKSAWRNKG